MIASRDYFWPHLSCCGACAGPARVDQDELAAGPGARGQVDAPFGRAARLACRAIGPLCWRFVAKAGRRPSWTGAEFLRTAALMSSARTGSLRAHPMRANLHPAAPPPLRTSRPAQVN